MAFDKTDAQTAEFASDIVSGFQYPKLKVAFGVDGSATDVSATNPLPITGALTIGAISAGANNIGSVNLAQYTPLTGRLPVDGSGVIQPVSLSAVPAHNVTNAGTFGVQATQSGNWTTRLADGAGNSITSALHGAQQALTVQVVDGSGNQVTSFGGTGATATDAAAFTRGTSTISPVAIAETSAPTLVSGKVGALSMTTAGELRVSISSGGVPGFAEDSAHTTGDTGILLLSRRNDSATSSAGTDGDYATLNTTSDGSLRVDASGHAVPITDNSGSITVDNGGTFAVQVAAAATGGYTPAKLISLASTNATSVKASAGTLGMCVIVNTNAAIRYLKFYNKASSPTVGTDTPVLLFAAPASTTGAGVAVPIPDKGINFSTGIAFAMTTGSADSDTGAVGAADLIVSYAYL